MGKVIVSNFSLSIDGYGAGPHQTKETPLGEGGETLHQWLVGTRAFAEIQGKSGGKEGVDSDLARRFTENVGAFILGRNMFGPVRGDWPDESWRGWWGDNPPYHAPTFVLTHYPRQPLEMEGGTTFYFVTDGIEAAMGMAREAAGDRNINVSGGVSTIRQFLQARLIDEAHFAISPIMLGSGESLFGGLDMPALGYRIARHVTTETAMHVILEKSGSGTA